MEISGPRSRGATGGCTGTVRKYVSILCRVPVDTASATPTRHREPLSLAVRIVEKIVQATNRRLTADMIGRCDRSTSAGCGTASSPELGGRSPLPPARSGPPDGADQMDMAFELAGRLHGRHVEDPSSRPRRVRRPALSRVEAPRSDPGARRDEARPTLLGELRRGMRLVPIPVGRSRRYGECPRHAEHRDDSAHPALHHSSLSSCADQRVGHRFPIAGLAGRVRS